MKHIMFFFAAVLITSLVLGQEVIFEKEVDLVTALNRDRGLYPIVNQETKDISIFVLGDKSIQGFLLNGNFEFISEILGIRPLRTDYKLAGFTYFESKYFLYFRSAYSQKMQVVMLNYTTGKSKTELLEFEGKREYYLTSANWNNKLYMFYAKSPDILKVYTFDSGKVVGSNEYSFNSKNYSSLLKFDDMLVKAGVYFVDNSAPTTLQGAASKVKLYTYDDKFVITFDQFLNRTSVFEIQMRSMTGELKIFDQPAEVTCLWGPRSWSHEKDASNSNSFIFEGILYQINFCPEKFSLAAFDMNNNISVAKFTLESNEEIPFQTGPFIHQGWSVPDKVEEKSPETTKQFFRKLDKLNCSVHVARGQQGLLLTIGGSELIVGGTAMNSMGMMGTVSDDISAIGFKYRSHRVKSRNAYFQQILEDSTYNPIAGDIKEDIVDKIKSQIESLDKKIFGEAVLRIGNNYYLTYYIDSSRKIYIKRLSI